MNGDETVPGAALLIAAAPAGKDRLVDAASALPALAAVRPDVLTGTAAANVVELDGPADPQTVLVRLRVAATVPGQLVVHLIGQLTLDRKQQLPHIALARTTAATVRYTALPWHWLSAELQHRRPGSTTILADLVADGAAWDRLPLMPGLAVTGAELYGAVTPPPGRRGMAEPLYSRAVAELLRAAAHRPPPAELHDLAAARAGLPPRARLLAGRPAPQAAFPTATPPGFIPAHAPAPAAAPPAAPGGAAPDAAPPVSLPQAVPPVSLPQAALSGSRSPDAAVPPMPARPSAEARPDGPRPDDPHPAILAAAHEGRHGEAAAMAAAWEQYALRHHGPDSAEAVHWVEVRADLARLAGDFARSCELWMSAATVRLGTGEAEDAPDVVAAVDRAHHCWEQLGGSDPARGLAGHLVALRRRVPGPRAGALDALERRIENLSAAGAN